MSTVETANWYASNGQPAPSACLKYNDASGVANYLTFSVVVSEEWDGGAEVTEHPVEVGANVADHVRVSLVKCELKVFNSNEPIVNSMTIGNIATVTPTRAALTLAVPMPSWTASKLSITYPTWNNPIVERAVIEGLAGFAASEAGGTGAGLVGVLGAELLAAFLLKAREQDVTQGTDAGLQPGSRTQPTFDVDQWPNGTDYVAAMHSLLVELKDAAQTFTVLGTKQTLYPMVIETLTFSRTAETGSGESVTIGLKEVRQVTTATVPAPIPNLPAGGGKPTVSHGGQDPAPPQQQSVASQGLTAILGALGIPQPAGDAMTILTVPTFSDPRWTQSTTFEGTKYQLQFTYNQTAACWYLDVADADGVDIYNGVKLTIGPLLLKKCKDPRRPPGDFVVISSTTVTTPPTMLELLPGSGRCTLLYVTSDWLAIVKSGDAAAIQALYAQIATGGIATSPVSTYGQG